MPHRARLSCSLSVSPHGEESNKAVGVVRQYTETEIRGRMLFICPLPAVSAPCPGVSLSPCPRISTATHDHQRHIVVRRGCAAMAAHGLQDTLAHPFNRIVATIDDRSVQPLYAEELPVNTGRISDPIAVQH
jgi:hypothetical protein